MAVRIKYGLNLEETMAIKQNAQKLLLGLFTSPQSSAVPVPITRLRYLVPEMSEGGYRSLVLYLERKNLLYREKIFGNTSLGITEEGKSELIDLFPALNNNWGEWDGKWMILIFLDAPKSDPSFRYLRQLLLSEKALALTRGVYLAAGSFSHRILIETKQLYHQSVAILSAEQWHLGVERPLIIKYYDLTSRAEVYSGISNEIDRLLQQKSSNKEFTDQQKLHFSSLISRFSESLREDPGFTTHYFPEVPGVLKIISQLQKLIKL